MVTRGETTRAAALLAGLVLASSACALVAEDRPGDRPTRATDFDSCPEISLQEVPEGFTLVRRRLRALPDNHMGEVATYRSGRQTLTLYSGPDLYDELEDLDTTAQAVDTADLPFTLYSTLLAPELLVAVVDVEEIDGTPYSEPCEDAGVLSKWLSREEMVEVLHEVRLARP